MQLDWDRCSEEACTFTKGIRFIVILSQFYSSVYALNNNKKYQRKVSSLTYFGLSRNQSDFQPTMLLPDLLCPCQSKVMAPQARY